MVVPTPDPPPWGFIEWFVTSLSISLATIVGYLVRTRTRLNSHTEAIQEHTARIKRLEDDHRSLRDVLARQPTREDLTGDMRRMQEMIESRFDQFNTRFDRLDNRVDSVLNKK